MRVNKSKEWWKSHYDNWLSSKLSIRVYCNNNGINKNTFYGWIKRFREQTSNDNISDSKIEWATLSTIASEDASYEPSYSSGIRVTIGKASIDIASDFDPRLLNSVIKVLLDNA